MGMRKIFLSLMSTALVLLLLACSSQNFKNDNQLSEASADNVKGSDKKPTTTDEVVEKEVETLKETSIESFLKENPNYKKENIESRWAVILDIDPGRNKEHLKITIRDQDTQGILILNEKKQKSSHLKKGQNIIIVTGKAWAESIPLQNTSLKLEVLDVL